MLDQLTPTDNPEIWNFGRIAVDPTLNTVNCVKMTTIFCQMLQVAPRTSHQFDSWAEVLVFLDHDYGFKRFYKPLLHELEEFFGSLSEEFDFLLCSFFGQILEKFDRF